VQSSAWDIGAQDTPSSDRMTPGVFKKTPMTDREYDRHITHVDEELALAEKNNMPDTATQFDWKGGVEGAYSHSRDVLHQQIIKEFMDKVKDVPRNRQAIVMAGLGGAGKSTAIRKNASSPNSAAGIAGIKYASYDADGNGVGDPVNYAIINPDDIKETLAKKNMIPKVDHLSPMESSTFAHEECSALSKVICNLLKAKGYNIIWDITAQTEKAATGKAGPLMEAGYEVDNIAVDVPIAQSQDSARTRHRKGQDRWNGGSGKGGRYVPPFLQAHSVDETGEYQSSNIRAAYTLGKAGYYRHSIIIDNTAVKVPGGNDIWPGKIVDRFEGKGAAVKKATGEWDNWGPNDYFTSPSYSDAPGTITAKCLDYREGRTSWAALCADLGTRTYTTPHRADAGNRNEDSWQHDNPTNPGSWEELEEAEATGLLTHSEVREIANLAFAHHGHI